MKKILTLLFTITFEFLLAQSTAPQQNILKSEHAMYAFKNATVIVSPSQTIASATLLIDKGKVVGIGKDIAIPDGYIVYQCDGKFIYPSFIDLYSNYGIKELKKSDNNERGPQFESQTKGAYSWNQALKPEFKAINDFSIDVKKAEELRKLGLGVVNTNAQDGISRGTSCVVALGTDKDEHQVLMAEGTANYSFKKGSSTQDYPESLMGSIALLRQTYYDAQWYSIAKQKDYNISLNQWIENQRLPQLFEVSDYRSLLRAAAIANEFGVKYIMKGGGDEYKRIQEVKAANSELVIPIVFPDAYDFSNPYDAGNVSLADLKHWELAPYNASLLKKNNINFSFTIADVKDFKTLAKNFQKLLATGLTVQDLLTALTIQPAKQLKMEKKIGQLQTGMDANFLITSSTIGSKEFQIFENWVEGKRYIIKLVDSLDIRGTYSLTLDTLQGYSIEIGGTIDNQEWKLMKDSTTSKVEVNAAFLQYTIKLSPSKTKQYRLAGTYDAALKQFSGSGETNDGRWVKWTAIYTKAFVPKLDTIKKEPVTNNIGEVWYPNMAYGHPNVPTAKDVLIENTTVWTNEKEGILKETDVFIHNGIIQKIGKGLKSSIKNEQLEIVDGSNYHLTAGLIDEHSHIACNDGVNEGTQSVTAEVRIGDVLTGDDINLYRQLAGGVTTAHILHGSANAMGGQTALIKLRWGLPAAKLKFEGADGFIKFALGENVKQSNWGDWNTVRYPQTRMGVEQVYIDAFTRARNYDQQKVKSQGKEFRRDLELDALSEILNKKRFITCHSYQQGEINMLMHVADSFNFRVNTFTHILEGYKVADKMKAHGVGASSFSDWWAYKYEVMEAIPYNGAIMHKMGIITAFNSDDAEMARRLNQEAAKAVKYGNVSEEEALKFVTLNPAKLLHIDQWVGSIKVGKQADLVLWNNHPLSIYAKPLKTFVDGICYFDSEKDVLQRMTNERERQRIIQKSIEDKEQGGNVVKPSRIVPELFHCNDNENCPR